VTFLGTAASSVMITVLAGQVGLAQTSRVSVSSTGEQANAGASRPALTSDGRWLAFESGATNLVAGDTNGARDVFVRDLDAGTTSLVSVGPDGSTAVFAEGPCISSNGRYVLFNGRFASIGNGVFLRDLEGGATQAIVVDPPSSHGTSYFSGGLAVSDDGRWVYYVVTIDSPRTTGYTEVLADRDTGTEILVTGGEAALGSDMSRDARYLVFQNVLSPAGRLVYVYDRTLATSTNPVRAIDGGVPSPNVFSSVEISADGRYLVFSSLASNLVAGDTNADYDVFVTDRDADGNGIPDEPSGVATTRVSVDSSGRQTAGGQPGSGQLTFLEPAISDGGRYVAFWSSASDLVTADTNGRFDVFLHDRLTGATTRASVDSAGAEGNLDSGFPEGLAVSRDGGSVVFASSATNLVPDDTNGVSDLLERRSERLRAVVPSTGSEEGGELVHLFGSDFGSPSSVAVKFGDLDAAIVRASATEIVCRTPPGTGTVDVRVTDDVASTRLTAVYAYVPLSLAARYGTVNVGRGDRQNVLLVNSITGDSLTRVERIAVGQAITAVVVPPASMTSARYVMYAWPGAPTATSLVSLPGRLGWLVQQTPFSGGTPQPAGIWNNAGFGGTLGRATRPSRSAPAVLFGRARGSARPARVTLQGIIEDSGSQSPTGFSSTNAVILRIE
jgi:IPT/TIG domain-containing protein